MTLLVEYKANAEIPGAFQQQIGNVLLVVTMMPALQIRRAVGVLRRILNLYAVQAAFTFQLLVCMTSVLILELKEILQIGQCKMTCHVLLGVYHTTAERLLVDLPLEDLLLDTAR